MKKVILTLLSAVALASSSHAGVILSDAFSYPDGGIVTNSAGVWAANTGTANTMLVTNQQLIVFASRSEDIAASLGSTYMTNGSTPALYASFTVRCTVRPTTASGGIGSYFAHFSGPNVNGPLSGARCRVWASITNVANATLADPNNFMLSIVNASGGNATNAQWTTELATNVTHTVVVKYEVGTLTSKMWINPTIESDPSVTGVDFPVDLFDTSGGLVNVTSFSFRQANASAGTFFIDNLKVGTSFGDATGQSPLISSIPNQAIPMNSVAGPIAFTVEDGQTVASSLIVSNTTSNPTLVPLANISIGGSDTNRTITVTPATGQQGTAVITTYVSDGVNTSSTAFTIKVGVPSISAIGNQISVTNVPITSVPFTVNDAEGDTLTLSSNISNPSLISSIAFGGSGANRTITITPVADTAGISTISVIVTDGFNSATQSFVVTFSPLVGLIYQDDFTYGDGSLVGAGGFWSTSSGTTLQLQVTNSSAFLYRTNSEDVNTSTGFGGGSPFAPASGVVLYSGFTISLSELPNTSGNYFAHFKDTGSNFRARIFVSTGGAAAGHYRVGIANVGGSVSANVSNDLATNTTYLVVSRYNVGTGESAVWVNPVTVASGGAVASDVTTTMTVAQYGLRQDTGIGAIFLDNLKIGTSLSDVATIPALSQTLTSQVINGELILSWSEPLFALQSASVVTGPYTTIPGATSPYTNSPTASEMYFRLKY